MPAALHHRRALLGAAIVLYAASFAAFATLEVPELGLGHLFYLPVALVALATGPLVGALGGVTAVLLWTLAALLNPHLSGHVLSLAASIRLVTYTSSGALVGWFAASNRELVTGLRGQADRDFLTGLANVRAFDRALAARVADRRRFAVVLVDMDGLKEINDRLGHGAGNDLLRRLAGTLHAESAAGDVVARIGGDEFAILVALDKGADAVAFCGRLERRLAEAGTAASVGSAFHPDDGDGPRTLFRRADERLYARKASRGRPARHVTLAHV